MLVFGAEEGISGMCDEAVGRCLRAPGFLGLQCVLRVRCPSPRTAGVLEMNTFGQSKKKESALVLQFRTCLCPGSTVFSVQMDAPLAFGGVS
mmetsp:Transcript_58736/g.96484  ORF Transcript_58736/g.96484 Transcript_58736/m.96484 type:complete len:92 (-) Transcript_58736:184-459(-)